MGEVLAIRRAFLQIMGAPKRASRRKRIGSEMRTNSKETSQG
jgi:hypothetical protein